MAMTDETLMAFADGELDPAIAGQVAQAISTDPALAARVAVFAQSRTAVAAALSALPSAPIPDPIVMHIRALATAQQKVSVAGTEPSAAPGNVVTLPQRRSVPFWQVPLAASIALIIGLGTAQFLRPATSAGGLAIAPLHDRALAEALSTQPSGTRQALANGAEVALIATFAQGDGGLCREFEFDLPDGVTTVAVACRSDGTAGVVWNVQLAIAAGAADGGYAPASSLEALDAWMDANGAGAPMTPEAEAAVLRP